MFIASFVPATVRFISDNSDCSTVGFITNLPSTLPTFTPAIGPLNGIFDIDTARDEAIIAVRAGSQSGSTDNTVEII